MVPAGSHLFSGYSQRGFAQDMFKQLMAIRQMFNLQESGPPGRQVLGCFLNHGAAGSGREGSGGDLGDREPEEGRVCTSGLGRAGVATADGKRLPMERGKEPLEPPENSRDGKRDPKKAVPRLVVPLPPVCDLQAARWKVVQIKLARCAAPAPQRQPPPKGTESQTENQLIPRSDPSLP